MSEPEKSGHDQTGRRQSTLLPTHMLAEEFGKVYIRHDGDKVHVDFTIRLPDLEGSEAENWQTVVALDASASMKDWFGRNLTGSVPPDAMKEYEKKGWIISRTEDQRRVRAFQKEAYEDAIKQGFVSFTENIVEPLARDFIGYLARELSAGGGAGVLYWACGKGGDRFEELGDFTEEQCANLTIKGPQRETFGGATMLVPALRHVADKYQDAPRGMYVFITDGRLDDLEELKKYTTQLAKEIEAEKRNTIKCVLVGVGDEIDTAQMSELDDLDTGTDVDIWDHKIAKEMRDLSDIIVEVVDETKIVAASAVVYDATGEVVHRFTDGLPVNASFTMSATSDYFELAVAGRQIRQPISAGTV